MVRKILLPLILMISLSSCGFFGSSVFPAAFSMDIGGFLNNRDSARLFILDNGVNDNLLILAAEVDGTYRALVFDTALNLRGYLQDNYEQFPPDSVRNFGLVDHDGDFVIGKNIIGINGLTEGGITESISVTYDITSASGIIPYTDSSSNQYYIVIDYDGSSEVYDQDWVLVHSCSWSLPETEIIFINQSKNDLDDVKFLVTSNNNITTVSKSDLYNHAMDISQITSFPYDFYLNDSNPRWITRCSRGLFTAQYNGDLVMYSNTGGEIGRIDTRENHGEVTAIDYSGEYYYVVVENGNNRIIKEKVPF